MFLLIYVGMLVISSREFRQNQRLYFEKADKGEQIIVQRGKDKSYVLTPVDDENLYFNAEMVTRIKKSLNEAEKGELLTINASEEITELLGL
jgi:hypothetical protein